MTLETNNRIYWSSWLSEGSTTACENKRNRVHLPQHRAPVTISKVLKINGATEGLNKIQDRNPVTESIEKTW